MKLIFKNVAVVNADGISEGDVFVANGKIVATPDGGEPFADEEADTVVYGEGKHLLPGAVDVHVHFREPGSEHKEDFESGSRAAAAGGVTTVLDMPNTKPPTVTRAALDEKRELAAQGHAGANIGFHFGVTGTEENLNELREVPIGFGKGKIAEGVCGFKVYMGSSTGNLLVEGDVLREIFEIARDRDVPVIVHAEDEARIRARADEFSDPDFAERDDARTHALVRDNECARLAVEAAIKLREEVGNRLHIAHMSTKEELELVREHACPELTCEVAPHHLFFMADDMADGRMKMNPPLRDAESVRLLWEALRDGTVTMLATDHAPHTLEEKLGKDASAGDGEPIAHWDAPAGVPGVEFLLPLMLDQVNEKMLSLLDVVRMLCKAPAEVFGLEGKGEIRVGADADLVLVDMDREQTVKREKVRSKCGWSPYEGYNLKGWPVMVVVGGEVVI